LLKRVTEVLNNQGENYILPFFWQQGETEEVLREYMAVIQNAGIGAVCLEARPHPDFAGPLWWRDLDIILDEARTRGMKVWILDDAHFPTGLANGALKEADPELCKLVTESHTFNLCGPCPQMSLDMKTMATHQPGMSWWGMMMPSNMPDWLRNPARQYQDEKLVAVLVAKVIGDGQVSHEVMDLTDRVQNGKLLWDVPSGMWRLFVIFDTHSCNGRTDYINVLDAKSCRVLLDEVHEKHYAHYQADFGKTILGFFSDEPLVGNIDGFDFNESIGRRQMQLPWSREVPALMEHTLGAQWKQMLPALWTDFDDRDLTARIRYAYMDIVTRLIETNFSGQVSKWCTDHGVSYIGHLIEDNDQHSRLGCSLGHFFRGLDGMHMGGIDDIGGQVILGGEKVGRRNIASSYEGEFYHFTLGKLGASHGHIDPKKQGRSMCEIFGAYSWSEGTRLMKYLTDHFLVRGINHYVPHAFNPDTFPAIDCPPHFYAHGNNPLYRPFGLLMRYMNRMCHLLNGGTHVAQAALLYHGEAEWTGDCMFMNKPARELLEHQIDFDIVPSDVFARPEKFNSSFDGQLHISDETYRALVIPYAEYLTKATAEFAARAHRAGFPVLFVQGLPSGICDEVDLAAAQHLLDSLKGCSVVPLDGLATTLRANGIWDITLSSAFAPLRYYHYRHEDDLYMFSNEDPGETFDGDILISKTGDAVLYDAYDNCLRPADCMATEIGTRLHLRLEPYQSVVLVFGDKGANLIHAPAAEGAAIQLSSPWQLSFAEAKAYPEFRDVETIEALANVGLTHPDFSGFLRYETEFEAGMISNAVLALNDVYEAAEVWVNGSHAGMRICPPYRFALGDIVKPGKNTLRIEVATTLERALANGPSFMGPPAGTPYAPTGILGSATIYYS
jgi:hypothetical protein